MSNAARRRNDKLLAKLEARRELERAAGLPAGELNPRPPPFLGSFSFLSKKASEAHKRAALRQAGERNEWATIRASIDAADEEERRKLNANPPAVAAK